MGTQDFVYTSKQDKPRHRQNMPADVETPVPPAWYATRPGDTLELDESGKSLVGNIGPSGGFALTLVAKIRPEIHLLNHEHAHDVEPLIAEVAMRRASYFTRAPLMSDVKFAMQIFSYDKEATKGEEKWRIALVHDCGHNEHRRREIVNSIPNEVIGGSISDLEVHIDEFWKSLERFI